jgi:hypothetical protein
VVCLAVLDEPEPDDLCAAGRVTRAAGGAGLCCVSVRAAAPEAAGASWPPAAATVYELLACQRRLAGFPAGDAGDAAAGDLFAARLPAGDQLARLAGSGARRRKGLGGGTVCVAGIWPEPAARAGCESITAGAAGVRKLTETVSAA